MGRTGLTLRRALVCLAGLVTLAALAVVFYPTDEERTEYARPPADRSDPIVDDRIEERNPGFDPDLADPRPLGEWSVNASAAVVRLDCPPIKPDAEAWMLDLAGSHAAAIRSRPGGESPEAAEVLPSASLLDASTRPADDGLAAALDLAAFQGGLGVSRALPDVVADLFAGLPKGSPARPFLGLALEIAGKPAALTVAEAEKKRLLARAFESDRERSRPIGFYDWTPELRRLWRFRRLLQEEFGPDRLEVPRDVAGVLAKDARLREEYRKVLAFHSRLASPGACLSADDLVGAGPSFVALAESRKVLHAAAAILPPLASREAETFSRLFPMGPPPAANLMAELVRRIRTGEVDLDPGKGGGWYRHQAFALEALLSPGKGPEKDKLLLTAAYKKRLLEAFLALTSKRRETRAREPKAPEPTPALPPAPGSVRPRLRLEPAPVFYLRTARAYAFLENFLRAAAGEERMKALHGLSESGERPADLAAEIANLRLRFYGFHLLSCEDIGMQPEISAEEGVDADAAKAAAADYLGRFKDDPDLARDVRLAVPVHVDGSRNVTRLWAVLGVRMAHLEASYAKPPWLKPLKGEAGWIPADRALLGESRYLIPVEEPVEITIPGRASLTRPEFRDLCDRRKTREGILGELKVK